MVVTLENWHIFGPVIHELLHSAITVRLADAGIAADIVKLMPLSIWHVADLERAAQILKHTDIRSFFDEKIEDDEKRHWEWRSYMQSVYGKQIPRRELFLTEYNEIFSEVLNPAKHPKPAKE